MHRVLIGAVDSSIVIKVPGPGSNSIACGLIREVDSKWCISRSRCCRKVGNGCCWQRFVDNDILGFYLGIASACIANCQIHGIVTYCTVNMRGILIVSSRIVPEVPEPGGWRTCGLVHEVNRKRSSTGRYVSSESSIR